MEDTLENRVNFLNMEPPVLFVPTAFSPRPHQQQQQSSYYFSPQDYADATSSASQSPENHQNQGDGDHLEQPYNDDFFLSGSAIEHELLHMAQPLFQPETDDFFFDGSTFEKKKLASESKDQTTIEAMYVLYRLTDFFKLIP